MHHTDGRQGYHIQVTARSDRDLTPEAIVQKVADSSGSKYSGGGSVSAGAGKPPPPASKPAFTPTVFGGASSGFNPLGSRSRDAPSAAPVDNDGWGHDAPELTRTQLEKVAPAYQRTQVNMAELTKQREPSRYQPEDRSSSGAPDVVRGGYQPIGKVDINAIRQQAKESGARDDRPTTIKGAYEPVGKVDIAAIRARAQAPDSSSSTPSGFSRDDEPEQSKPLASRSAAFQQSERMTSMPKPKVANKFGGGSSFTGTKAPAPGGYGQTSTLSAAPVGVASRTFADEGGKTPAQIWAEKKAREGGSSVTSSQTGAGSSPVMPQKSGDGGWKSGYTGKSWASVQTTHTGRSSGGGMSAQHTGEEAEQQEPGSPAGGVGAMRDRFAGAAPMGAPSGRAAAEERPPPMDFSSKPNAGTRGVAIPGMSRPAEEHVDLPPPPARPQADEEEEEEEQEQYRSSSPIRIAMPVSHTREPVLERAEELHSPEPLPIASIAKVASATRNMPPEPQMHEEDPARGAAQAAAATTFGEPAPAQGGHRALVQYDYEKAEDNEVELREGSYVTDVDQVDTDWWMGTNEHGERGLFPANYVEIEEDGGAGAAPAAQMHHQEEAEPEPEPAAPQAAASGGGQTATAQYDYDAAESNELSFPDGATIHNVVSQERSFFVADDLTCLVRNSQMMIGGLASTKARLACSPRIMCS